jgi:probable phosphoglycerate mutase
VSERVWLARHASTDWTGRRWCGTTDLPLNEPGRAEAERLAAALAERVPQGAALVSSPLRRALQSAAPVARAIGSPVSVDGRLREVDFGAVEGLDWPTLEVRHPHVAEAIATGATAIDWPAGETGVQVRARVADLWRDIGSRAAPVVLISHGAFLRVLLDEVVGPGRPDLAIAPATVIEVERRGRSWVLTP